MKLRKGTGIFNSVNSILKSYKGEQIEIWDDLWFWGFTTQQTTEEGRIFDWNENKYWALKESDKNPLMIALEAFIIVLKVD